MAKKSTSKKSTKKSAAKKTAKKSTKKSAKKSAKKSTKKSSRKSTKSAAAKTVEPQVITKEITVEKHQCYHEPTEEHRVFSHLMYILFLVAAGIAALYTFNMWASDLGAQYLPMKALVLLGWAYFFKTFAHRIHHPHH